MFKGCVQHFASSAAYISLPVDIATDMTENMISFNKTQEVSLGHLLYQPVLPVWIRAAGKKKRFHEKMRENHMNTSV